jgi:hypothetical protein
MDTAFLYHVILSFVIAGGWIAVATVLAEKLGSNIGGLIANLPSNILIGLLFIALTQNIEFVKQAVPGIPVGMLIDTLFLAIFIAVLKYGLPAAVSASLLFWFLLAFLASEFWSSGLLLNCLVYLIVAGTVYFSIHHWMTLPPSRRLIKRYSGLQVLIRALFAGSVVASVVVIARFAPPYLVGIVATFPAVLLSTMVILAINQTPAFAQATGKILLLSSSNIVVYGIVVYLSYPLLGIAGGTVVSFVAAALWVWMLKPLIGKIS